MTTDLPRGASVIVIGGGVTGLSTGWWLARENVDVLVLEKGELNGEASGRNGGGCSHHHSPLFAEEQRLWPMMDELRNGDADRHGGYNGNPHSYGDDGDVLDRPLADKAEIFTMNIRISMMSPCPSPPLEFLIKLVAFA